MSEEEIEQRLQETLEKEDIAQIDLPFYQPDFLTEKTQPTKD